MVRGRTEIGQVLLGQPCLTPVERQHPHAIAGHRESHGAGAGGDGKAGQPRVKPQNAKRVPGIAAHGRRHAPGGRDSPSYLISWPLRAARHALAERRQAKLKREHLPKIKHPRGLLRHLDSLMRVRIAHDASRFGSWPICSSPPLAFLADRTPRPRRRLLLGPRFEVIMREPTVSRIPLVFALSIAFLLLIAAIAANIGGHMPEMRGAWVGKALR